MDECDLPKRLQIITAALLPVVARQRFGKLAVTLLIT